MTLTFFCDGADFLNDVSRNMILARNSHFAAGDRTAAADRRRARLQSSHRETRGEDRSGATHLRRARSAVRPCPDDQAYLRRKGSRNTEIVNVIASPLWVSHAASLNRAEMVAARRTKRWYNNLITAESRHDAPRKRLGVQPIEACRVRVLTSLNLQVMRRGAGYPQESCTAAGPAGLCGEV
jgi:hypothetical protein